MNFIKRRDFWKKVIAIMDVSEENAGGKTSLQEEKNLMFE